MSVETTIRDLADWLLTDGKRIQGTEPFEEALIEKLRAAGLPIERFTTGVPSLHPQVDSFSTLWEEGKGMTVRQFRMDPALEEQLLKSAIFAAYEGRIVHCSLEGPPEEGEYDILPDLRDAGYTDYLVIPVPFSDGSNKAVSFATRRAGGFAEDEVAVLKGISDALAAAIEIHYLRHMAGTLVRTYIGPAAGEKVLAGAIKRGGLERIEAVVWFCDLRGFTELSQRLEGEAMVALLNDYFGAMGEAIGNHGGEILKFIGDAMLAIFPFGARGRRAVAAAKAFDAAREAKVLLGEANRRRAEAGSDTIRYGIALHAGDVLYGNVGAEERLDFTVIGPAVNLASRIEALCGALGRDLLASEAFVSAHGAEGWEHVGDHEMKGIAGAQPVFARA